VSRTVNHSNVKLVVNGSYVIQVYPAVQTRWRGTTIRTGLTNIHNVCWFNFIPILSIFQKRNRHETLVLLEHVGSAGLYNVSSVPMQYWGFWEDLFLLCRYVYTMMLSLIIPLLLCFNLQFFHFCIPLVIYSLRSVNNLFKTTALNHMFIGPCIFLIVE